LIIAVCREKKEASNQLLQLKKGRERSRLAETIASIHNPKAGIIIPKARQLP
jgi:hypothetical protein